MRMVAIAQSNNLNVRRIIVHCPADEDGSSVFYFDKDQDCDAYIVDWYKDLAYALDNCLEKFGIDFWDWQEIPEPEENCRPDWMESIPMAANLPA